MRRNLHDFILEEVGSTGDLCDTAIDDTSFDRRQSPEIIYDPHGSKPLFTASFPVLGEPGWLRELRSLKARDISGDLEIKWRWFRSARNGMSQQLRSRVYAGLGEAIIFINDLHPFLEENRCLFLEAGFSKGEVEHPLIRQRSMDYAAERLLSCTPIREIHGFEPNFFGPASVPIDTGDVDDVFDLENYLHKIKDGKGRIRPQNAQLLAAEAQAGFQEIIMPDTWHAVVDHYYRTSRYLCDEEAIRSRVVLLSLVPKRMFDGGNKKVTSIVKELRHKTSRKIKDSLRFEFVEWEGDELGATVLDLDSADSYEIQMADLAAGYAEELFREKYQRNIHRLYEHFKCVLYNGELVPR